MAMKFPFKLPFLQKEEFREDKPRSGLLSKLYLTQKQRLQLLKWALYALVLVVLSVVQDVLLSRFSIFGTTTELVPCGIFLIVVAEGMETGSVFSLIAACCYLFSGSAAGNYTIVIITLLGIGAAFFRQSYLQKGFSAAMLCTAAGMILYELAVFLIGLFLGFTTFGRIGTHFLTGVYSLVFAPVLYPLVKVISGLKDEGQN